MQIGTVRTDSGTRAARLEADHIVLLDAPDAGAVIRSERLDAAATATGPSFSLAAAHWTLPVADPDKIICVGLNYREHIAETGRELIEHPTYFAKYRGSLIGDGDDIHLPPEAISTSVDWEVELCVVIGRPARNVAAADALGHVAGYTAFNDVSVRDWQTRSGQFLAGKTFEHTTPVGPVITTTDELGDGRGLRVTTTVDGTVKQESTTDELLFGVPQLIHDLSTIITLQPGDLIATGTPSGVGARRSPPEWLTDGAELVTAVEGIGELRNRCVRVG